MTYLLAWIICSICTYCIAKSHLEKLFSPYGGLVSACRKLWLNDPENTYEDNFTLENTPDNVIGAILWTLLLIACLLIWPLIILQLVYWMIFKPDMTEFEEMFK